MAKTINWLGRALGLVCAAGLAGAWAFALWVPIDGITLSGGSVVVTSLVMAVLALFAGIASLRGHPTVVVLILVAVLVIAAVVALLVARSRKSS